MFEPGEEVFVKGPERYSPGATCIVGKIIESRPIGSARQHRVDAEIVVPGGNRKAKVWVHEIDLGHQIGVPLSQLSLGNGRTTPQFDAIAESWGYP